MPLKPLLFLLLLFTCLNAFSQVDVEFHITAHLLPGKNILKVKRDFNDPYLWVLAQNNEVYRINSETRVVENFTNKFTAYAALHFIDIAGRSKNTVYIASNSTNLIEYKNAVIRVIGAADGITKKINSIGIDKSLQSGGRYYSLIIGSPQGLYTYNMASGIVKADNTVDAGQVYEATSRNLVYKDSADIYPNANGRKRVPIKILGDRLRFQHYMFESTDAGDNVNTAYESFGVFYDLDRVDFNTALFWGTRNGLMQVSGFNSYYLNRSYGHYLRGVNVNKITAMFGLTAFGSGSQFGDKGLIKETLLIGTDKGLYFGKSIFGVNGVGQLRHFEFFSFTGLANKVINDICVNTTLAEPPFCDDGVWVAAENGLYLITPDYAKFAKKTIKAIQFEGQDAAITATDICAGDNATLVINEEVYNSHAIQWYKNGIQLPGEINPQLNATSDGSYNAIVYDPCLGSHFNSNKLKVTVVTTPTVTLNYPDKSVYCDGNTVLFEVAAKNNYQYRWYKNGVLNGNTSNSIHVTKSGKYKVEVSACEGTWVTSKEIEADFVKLPAPVLKTDKAAYCIGEQATLSVNVPANTSYTINWLRDGTLLNDYTNKTTLTTNVAGNYMVKISSHEITCIEKSRLMPVIFNPLPTISLEKIVNTTLCSGQPVDLKATFSNGTVKWSTGETNSRISVKNSGDYTAVVTSSPGCTDSSMINVQFFNTPLLNLQDASLCQFTQQQITLHAPPGFTKYMWNGTSGGDSFTTGSLGDVELIVTDLNGCTASQTIHITSYCTEIKMGNTFTPNADGVNDKWTIEGLDNSATVKVYTRSGTLVFDSRGYTVPWDGTYKGSKLPTGTYYYIINAKAGTQVVSGWVSIIY